jgi:hypothetical protein
MPMVKRNTKPVARRTKPLIANVGESDCFSDLRYSKSAGGVFATFAKDGSQYFYDMSRANAKDWFENDLGEYFNAEVRE